MKHNLENIPEVSIDKVDAFYVTGTQHRDAAGKTNNLKLNLKTLGGGIDLTDREALKALWSALQDAIQVVITEADVEEVTNEGFTSYRVVNTEGFPDISSEYFNPSEFSPKIRGIFKDTNGEEAQVNSQLSFEAGDPIGWIASIGRRMISLVFNSDTEEWVFFYFGRSSIIILYSKFFYLSLK